MPAEIPTITVEDDDGVYVLVAKSYGRKSPAGPRLFHAAPHPDVKFQHPELEPAQRDAKKLRDYLEGAWSKDPSKSKVRKAGQ